ncbi:MAG TPA: class I SAM-dependent methyltransferase [Candidatus Sulfotelmatobacter sp.]
MTPNSATRPSVFRAASRRWRETARHAGHATAARQLLSALWEFARDSTPERRKLRYGDAEYDWEKRVNTTSGAVGWRDRLLGVFHSEYQPTDPFFFREMMDALLQQAGIQLHNFTFVDIGSGKGRVLMMASEYPFRRVIGVELIPALHQIARANLSKFHSDAQQCFRLESVCCDAAEYDFPAEPAIVYLFHSLPEAPLRRLMVRLEQSLRQHPRPVLVIYHNPVLEHVLAECARLKKVGGTSQSAIYAAR